MSAVFGFRNVLFIDFYLYKSINKKHQGVFVKHYAPAATESEKAIFITKDKVKVTRSFALCHLKGYH